MAYYESIFIARQDVSAAQVDSLAETFTGIITEGGGEVTKKEYWGLRSLMYRIKKNRKGHYVLLNIDGPSSAVQEMERNMRINEDVIRYLTLRVDELESEESAILRHRGSRDSGRGGRRGDRWGPRGGDRRDGPAESADKPADKPTDKPAEKPADKPADDKGGET